MLAILLGIHTSRKERNENKERVVDDIDLGLVDAVVGLTLSQSMLCRLNPAGQGRHSPNCRSVALIHPMPFGSETTAVSLGSSLAEKFESQSSTVHSPL